MEEGSAAWTEEEKMCNEQQCFGYMSEIGLLFYEVTAVVYYLFMNIHEVCYWSELHIYFVNHECLC